MSRSFKKTPRGGEQKDKFFKNYAARRIRRDKTFDLKGSNYKKHSCYYDICDFETIATFELYWKRCVENYYRWRFLYEDFPDREKEYQKWFRWFKRK